MDMAFFALKPAVTIGVGKCLVLKKRGETSTIARVCLEVVTMT